MARQYLIISKYSISIIKLEAMFISKSRRWKFEVEFFICRKWWCFIIWLVSCRAVDFHHVYRCPHQSPAWSWRSHRHLWDQHRRGLQRQTHRSWGQHELSGNGGASSTTAVNIPACGVGFVRAEHLYNRWKVWKLHFKLPPSGFYELWVKNIYCKIMPCIWVFSWLDVWCR